MKRRIVINDANILIDFISIGLLDVFFQLAEFELMTTDFIYNELYPEQQDDLAKYIKDKKLTILRSEEKDIISISEIFNKINQLSFQDCSALYYTKKTSGILLTGDGKLRKQSTKESIEVHGSLFVLNYLVKTSLLSAKDAILKLDLLYFNNNRLPLKEKEKLIKNWSEF